MSVVLAAPTMKEIKKAEKKLRRDKTEIAKDPTYGIMSGAARAAAIVGEQQLHIEEGARTVNFSDMKKSSRKRLQKQSTNHLRKTTELARAETQAPETPKHMKQKSKSKFMGAGTKSLVRSRTWVADPVIRQRWKNAASAAIMTSGLEKAQDKAQIAKMKPALPALKHKHHKKGEVVDDLWSFGSEAEANRNKLISTQELFFEKSALKGKSILHKFKINHEVSKEDISVLSLSHNPVVRARGWFKAPRKPDPEGWKNLCKNPWERALPSSLTPRPPSASPGPGYIPPGLVKKSEEERQGEVYCTTRHARDLSRLKFRINPAAGRNRSRRQEAAEDIKAIRMGQVETHTLLSSGRLMPSGLTDLQEQKLQDRGYKLEHLNNAIQYHVYYKKVLETTAKKLFFKMDWNGSGTVALSEFEAGKDKYELKPGEFMDIEFEGNRRQVFKFIDFDNDGLCTKKEWTILDRLGEMYEKNRKEMEAVNRRLRNNPPPVLTSADKQALAREEQAEGFRDEIMGIFKHAPVPTEEEEDDFFLKRDFMTPGQKLVRDVCNDYKMNQKVALELKARFDSFDSDLSGEIDRSEFEPLLRGILAGKDEKKKGIVLTQTVLNKFWDMIDEDKQGSISFDELCAWIVGWRDGTNRMPEIPVQGKKGNHSGSESGF